MKKIIILFAAFSLTITLAQAQGGYGRNDGARFQRGGHTTYSGAVVTHNRSYGHNRGAVVNNGFRHNGYQNNACAPQQRVRYEWSNCGTFQWQIVEQAYWVPPQMVYTNGCRSQVAGFYDWRCTNRSRVYASNCGPRGRRW